MDANRFDALSRTLFATPSRRGVCRALAGLTLAGALAPLLSFSNTGARNKRKKRRKKRKPTCFDGIKNGSETDLDCGGSCPRCANFKICVSRNDCASALCTGGACQECPSTAACGADTNGEACLCRFPSGGGPRVCTASAFTPPPVSSCTSCPTDTVCIGLSLGTFGCYERCGAS